MSFGQSDVNLMLDGIVSHALTLGVFESVNTHEPKSAPGTGIRAAAWVDAIRPIARASGLAATSGAVDISFRLYTSFVQQPFDSIDPNMLTAASTLMGALSGDFELGGAFRCIDLLGMYGPALTAQAGYLNQDGKLLRIMTVTIPVIINDMWSQSP